MSLFSSPSSFNLASQPSHSEHQTPEKQSKALQQLADLATQQELNDTRWTGARKQGGTTTYILAVQEIELLTLQSKNSLIRPLGHNCPFTAGKPFVCVCVI